MISLELVGDAQAAGLQPRQLADLLTERYASELTDPRVTVIVRGFGGSVYVGGEVKTGQAVPFTSGMTVLQAIHTAGGFVNTARRSDVVIIRRENGKWTGFTTDLTEPLEGGDYLQDVQLQAYDIVHVPKSRIANTNLFIEQYIRNMLPVQPILPAF